MKSYLPQSRAEKLEEILKTISGKFDVPLSFADTDNVVLFSAGPEGADCAGSQVGSGAVSVPVRFMDDIIGNLIAPSSSCGNLQIAAATAYCLEGFLKYETEIDDLSSEVVRVYEELSLLYSLSNKLGSELDVDTICRRVLEETSRFVPVQNTSIMLMDAKTGELRTGFAAGRDAGCARDFRTDSATGFIGHVLRSGQPVTVCDIRTDDRIILPYPAVSILCVPLITDDRPIGLLLACDKLSGEEFWSRELKLMGLFASEVAASIRKAQLYEEIRELFISTVEALSSAIDAKDPYTYGHSRRVARFSVAICEELGMSKNKSRLVELASLLHDIGKIGTPESILHKPGALKPEEFEKMKEHPARGAEILSNIGEFGEIIKWIRHHHEWYDGRGYPDGIAAEEIPLEARIITIADAFDAMTSDRPYRKGMPPPEVMKVMDEYTSRQFDPNILNAFKQLVESGKIM